MRNTISGQEEKESRSFGLEMIFFLILFFQKSNCPEAITVGKEFAAVLFC